MNFFKKNKELLFVKFPFMFPIIYGVFLYAFPGYELYLIFFTILKKLTRRHVNLKIMVFV